MQTRRQLLASAVPAVALVGFSGVKPRPSKIARLVAEFDAALDRSIRAEKDYNTGRPEADFDAECKREDAFCEILSLTRKAAERLIEAVRKVQPGAVAFMGRTHLYVFHTDDELIRRIDIRALFTL